MYIGFQQVGATVTVQGIAAFTVPPNATQVELQSDTNHVRYRMDGGADPTPAAGMLLLTTSPPKLFLIEDFLRIRFVHNGVNGNLNVHFVAGRNV